MKLSRSMSKKREALLQEFEVENRRSTLGGVFFLQVVAERSGMNLTDLQCLAVLTATGPLTAGQLAEAMGLTTGAITGVVNRLEQAGYVQRSSDPDDGRRVIIRPDLEALESIGMGFFSSVENDTNALLAKYSELEYSDRDLGVIVDFMRRGNTMTEEETARLRMTSEGSDQSEFAPPLGSVESGRLVFANGASKLTLRAASGMDDLCWARFEGTSPKVEVEAGTVTVRYPRRFFGFFNWRSKPGEVTLNSAVPWAIEVHGGASEVEADLGGVELTSFVFKLGQYRLDLTLPEPVGAVPIHLSGGASHVNIRRPTGVAVRVSLKGGVGTLDFDEQHFDALGGKVLLQSPGYDGTSDLYEIEISGGADKITIR